MMIVWPAAVTCWCQKASCQRELQPEHKYWLVFQCAEQVWRLFTDAKLMLHCLGTQQVKTPPRHSFRLFSCYICTLQPTASRAVCAVNAYISHRVHARKNRVQGNGLTRWCVQGLWETGTSYILWLMVMGLTWAVIWEDWSQRNRVRWIPTVLLQT